MSKILIICGPTATGKTDLAVSLAHKFSAEIVSADSRQVYRGMDIVTGKDINKNSKLKTQNSKLGFGRRELTIGYRLKDKIPIWLVDIVSPDYFFNVSDYQKSAMSVLDDIWSRGKLPIIAGGTGLYIKSILDPLPLISIPPDEKLRTKLSRYNTEELVQILKKKDLAKWRKMNASDRLNPRRLIRAIEISSICAKDLNTKQYLSEKSYTPKIKKYLLIGLKADNKLLYKRIDTRVEKRISQGAIEEIKSLLLRGYSFDLPSFSACGYRLWQQYFELEGRTRETKQQLLKELVEKWKFEEHHLARRQMTYFNKLINQYGGVWFDIAGDGYKDKIEETVNKWYTFVES